MTRIGAIRVAIIQSYKAASDFPAPRRFGGKHTSTLALAGGVRLSTIAHQNRPPCGLRVNRQEREYLTKWQFGNQINPDHVIPTLTRDLRKLRDSAEPALEATRGKKFHGSGTFVRTTPIRQPSWGLMRLLTQSGVGVEKVTSISRMKFGRSMLEESIRTCFV